YKARQTALNRLVAIKMIRGQERPSDEQLARFQREAEALARLQHPNIVQVYEIGEDNGQPFFSLEVVPGGGLDPLIAGTPQPAGPCARLLATLADAVHAAHQAGVIHRDLKPANILVTLPGEQSKTVASTGAALDRPFTPKITDFGLAKNLTEDAGQTVSGVVMGTPSYMAPEQAEGRVRDINARTDVYALGAILYECLTGRPPFKGASLLDTLEQVRFQDPVPPSRLAPKLPRDLETVCLKCLRKEAPQRYQSALQLADDLQRFLDG